MIYISHRGNIDGPNKALENTQDYIVAAIDRGYDVEVDVWYLNDSNEFFLGHDNPEHIVDYRFLKEYKDNLWIHCKNADAFRMLLPTSLNVFVHDVDMYAITSKSFVWAFPDNPPVSLTTVCVLPEYKKNLEDVSIEYVSKFWGVCSDYIDWVKQCLEK